MFSHVSVGTNDLSRALAFYDAVMAVLGHERFFVSDRHVGYGTLRGQKLWVMTPFDGAAATVGNGTHVAFEASDRATVDAFHATALEAGGTDEGPPGPRPHYHRNYYGAYVRDPDGNKLQAACHRRPPAAAS